MVDFLIIWFLLAAFLSVAWYIVAEWVRRKG